VDYYIFDSTKITKDGRKVIHRKQEIIVMEIRKKMTRWFHLLKMSTERIVTIPLPIRGHEKVLGSISNTPVRINSDNLSPFGVNISPLISLLKMNSHRLRIPSFAV
jgi:hypothetical protein